MIPRWLLLLTSVLYVGGLFALAYHGDRRPLHGGRSWLRPLVYSLTLAVYCSSWTLYGAVGTAARDGLAYLPIYIGPILLFVVGFGLFERLVIVARERRITSIADFIGSRFGKSHALGALVTLIAIIAAVPYLALQLKAIGMSFDLLAGHGPSPALLGDTTLYVALLLAAFSILFGTRGIDASEHHRGMMLAIAAESLVKLLAFVAVGVYALTRGGADLGAFVKPIESAVSDTLPRGFIAQSILAFLAILCLPRQFQVGVVECEAVADTRVARWLFPAYLAVISLFALPIAQGGALAAQGHQVDADAYVLWLPLANGDGLFAVLAYIGGFSAATGMVIVASVALATMISNELVMPALLRVRMLHLEQREDLSAWVLGVRRAAIVALVLLAFAYYRASTQNQNLAAMGLLAFAAVAQFAPAIIVGLYWRSASRQGVMAGLGAGFAVWCYTLLAPTLTSAGWFDAGWVGRGPYDIGWLRPHALFNLSGWDPLTHATFWSLLLNSATLLLVSLRLRPSIDERLRAAAFLDPEFVRAAAGELRGRVRVADLRAIAERILGERSAQRAFAAWEQASGGKPSGDAYADRALVQRVERLLASAIGAASARRMLTSALRGTGLDVAEAVALLDETSQELRFNRALMAVTFENMLQGISVVDAQLRIVAWNRRYLDFFDYPEGFLYVGRPVVDLMRHNARQGLLGPGAVDELVRERLQHLRRATPHMYLRTRSDGRVIESRGDPLPDGGYLTTFTDVTAYKHAEQALIEANETLEQRVGQRTRELSESLLAQEQAKRLAEAANLSKTRFLAAASHDLLQPLNAARLFTSALRQRPGLDAESSRLAERIDTAFKTAEELLDALLEASRLDAGKYQPEVVEMALADVIEPLRHQFGVQAAARGIRLRLVDSGMWVRSDAQLLRRILQNFLANALRYTRKGSVLLIARREGAAGVRVEVRDSGLGISDEQQRAIFDEFHRGTQTSPWGEKGLGLGLAICERMARLLGHRLGVRSRLQRGSVFSVSLPRARPRPAASAPEAPATHAIGLAADLHVLCIDNEASVLDGMATLLGQWGVSCDLAGGIDEAVAAVRRRRPDLVLADYHLDGDEHGLDALARVREACAVPPPGALVTADHGAELQSLARAAGYVVLRKPVRPAALRAFIAQLGRRSRAASTATEADDAAD
ncbi:MAG: hybrid sensor histidine kinase/response regulator [Dokdonella sp.]|uniref:hybrid sensor histidine kinase/response regulator n=1 Tax=Dokdonella sp. TaxID=2291710 RepID=UPI0025C3F51B|nr:PAS domain-containing hybrid sensor histidine kinase/response regulator [Dokdonella sp.]MBX3700367.1 hybrid sensor histidine kinase/response regulator [Dokdonella sp.]